MRTEYDPWAVYYDWLHQGLPGELEFYVRTARESPGTVLELGVGTGRVAIAAAAAGAHLLGLDISEGMLAICGEKLRLNQPLSGGIYLVRGDMRRFAFRARFHTIIMPYRTFMHLLTVEEQRACLGCVREHLAPEGRFVFNLWAAHPASVRTLHASSSRRFKLVGKHPIPEEGILLRHYYRAGCDRQQRIIAEQHRVEEVALRGNVNYRVDLEMRRTWFAPEEIETLLRGAGLIPDQRWGGFEGEPLTPESREMVWVARRNESGGK